MFWVVKIFFDFFRVNRIISLSDIKSFCFLKMVREDLINFVLENIILTLWRWGFPDDIFQYLHFVKIY